MKKTLIMLLALVAVGRPEGRPLRIQTDPTTVAAARPEGHFLLRQTTGQPEGSALRLLRVSRRARPSGRAAFAANDSQAVPTPAPLDVPWTMHGGVDNIRYSPLTQINRSNVTRLQVA